VFSPAGTATPPALDLWATTYGNVVLHWSAGTLTEVPFACREARSIVPDSRGGVIVTCDDDYPVVKNYRVTDAGASSLTPDLAGGTVVALAPDGRQMVVYRKGDCPGPAPVCDYRFMLRDLPTGSERVLLPNGYYLGSTMAWTTLGLTYVQPECADAGCSGSGDRSGTFVWDGAKLVRESPLRFVAGAGPYRVYERGTQSNRADASVVLVGPSGAVDLTPAGRRERALSVTAGGEVVAGTTDFGLVGYDAKGAVTWHARMEDGSQGTRAAGEFVVTTVYSGVGVPTFHVYDVKRGLRFVVSLGAARVWTAVPR
jgi:hypothetical protein